MVRRRRRVAPVAPTIGVIIADYWVTKRRAVDTPELFKVPPPDWAADPGVGVAR